MSDDTKVCLEELDKAIETPFNMQTDPTDFTLGKPNCPPSISKPIVDDILAQAIAGLLRIKGLDCKYKSDSHVFRFSALTLNNYFNSKSACTESSMKTFTEGVGEFYKCLLDKVNQVVSSQGKDINVSSIKHTILSQESNVFN